MVKVLVATAKTQGARANDYNWCVDGEFVWFPPQCGSGSRDPDDDCGCGRGFGGLSSRRATTTAMVRTLDMGKDDYVAAIRSSLDVQGYEPAAAAEVADEIITLVADFPDGAVVEHRMDHIQERRYVP